MKKLFIMESRARLRTWLVAGYLSFIVYASLSPFSGWREQGLHFADVLVEPLRLTYTSFDAAINLLSYLPLGLLLGLALRARFGGLSSIFLSVAVALLLSGSMEYLQMYLPTRTSSNMDILSNSSGALIGAMLALSITSWTDLFSAVLRWRGRVFQQGREMDFGLALLVLWMFGQINPSLPMLGNVFISGVARKPFVAPLPTTFNIWESSAVMLNLLMLGILLLTLLRTPRNIIGLLMLVLGVVATAKFMTAVLLLKSWALLLWINSEAILGMLAGMVLLVATRWLSHAALISLGVAIALSYFVVINFVVDSNTPVAAMSIYHWRYGHLLNYNGLAQTITLIFPLLLVVHLWQTRKV